MEIKIAYNMKSSRRIKSILLTTIYFFILTLTTFHHHPIDLGDKLPLLKNSKTGSNSYSYTAKDCPVLNFANNGFNSSEISQFSFSNSDVRNAEAYPEFESFKNNIIFHTIYLRGPPTPLFI